MSENSRHLRRIAGSARLKRLQHGASKWQTPSPKDPRRPESASPAAPAGDGHGLPALPASVSARPTAADRASRLAIVNTAHAPAHPMRPGLLGARGGAATYDAAPGVVRGQWDELYNPAKSPSRGWAIFLMILIALVWGAGFLIGFQASLAVLMVVGLLLSVAGLLLPGLGILAIGMVAALDAMANIYLLTGGLLRYNTVNYWLVLVMAFYIPFILRLRDFNSRALQVFVLLLGLELFYSADKSRGIQDILNIGVTFGMVVYFARALKDEISLYYLGLVNGLLAGLGGLVFFLQMNNLPYANPNDWTYFQLTALFSICVSYRYAIKYQKGRLLLLALAALNFAWIFLSASRGSLLVASICGVYLFLATRSITWKTVMIVVAALAAVWISAAFADQQIYTISRIQLLFDPNADPSKRTSKRSVITEAGLRIFSKNPMGIGTGGFAEESMDTGLLASQRPAHSAWIKVLAENGVLGILLMVIFTISYAIVGFRNREQGLWLFAVFITLVLISAFVAKEFRGKSLWFLAAAGIALLHPEDMLSHLRARLKPSQVDYRQRLREIRYGRK